MSKKGEPREPTWTESELTFLRANYIQMPIADIAERLGRSYESVRRKAAKIGVQRQEWGERFTPAEDDLLREKFATSPMSEMTALLGRHHNSIRHRAHALGLVNGEQVKRRRISAGVRHDYFSQIDSPVKAYLLGLMVTDGNIDAASNGVGLKVNVKDIELPELMRDEVSPHSSVHIYTYPPLPGYTKERQVAEFSVGSAQMKADLGNLGVVPRKSFVTQWPHLEPAFTAPFVLGCFDGDGCIALTGRPWRWRWILYSASAPFLVAARDAIQQHTGLRLLWATSKRGLHELRLNGGEAMQALDAWLRADVPGLRRKRIPPGAYARAQQEILAQRVERSRRRSLVHYAPEKIEQAQHLRTQGLSLDKIAAETGISRTSVYRFTRRDPV